MPKRVIDFDAMWGSDKLAACADWAQAEYAWLYGLADASGCFEMTNLRVIWGRVAAVRGNFTIERLEQVFSEFQDKGLLFVWEHEGKRYAHWTGSDVPGRLPPPSWRMRLEKFAPPVPKAMLAEYMARFGRGRAVLARSAYRGEGAGSEASSAEQGNLKFGISGFRSAAGGDRSGSGQAFQNGESRNCDLGIGGWNAQATAGRWRESGEMRGSREIGIKGGVEEDQEQDLDLELNLDLKKDGKKEWERGGGQFGNFPGETEKPNQCKIESADFSGSRANSKENTTAKPNALIEEKTNSDGKACVEANCPGPGELNSKANASAGAQSNFNSKASSRSPSPGNDWRSAAEYRMSAREIALEKELRVGAGPVCGPVRIRPEVLERIRLREEKWARERAGTRAP